MAVTDGAAEAVAVTEGAAEATAGAADAFDDGAVTAGAGSIVGAGAASAVGFGAVSASGAGVLAEPRRRGAPRSAPAATTPAAATNQMATGTPRFGVRSFARGRSGGVGIDEEGLASPTGGTLAKLSGDGTPAAGGITTAAMCWVRAQGSTESRVLPAVFGDGYSVASDPGGTMVSSGLDNIGDRASKAAAARSRSEDGGSDFMSVSFIAAASSASGRSDAPGGDAGTDLMAGIDGAIDGGPGGAVGATDIPVDAVGASG